MEGGYGGILLKLLRDGYGFQGKEKLGHELGPWKKHRPGNSNQAINIKIGLSL